MPPKRSSTGSDSTAKKAKTASAPSNQIVQKAIPPIDSNLARDFKRVDKIQRKNRTLEERKIYVRYKAFYKRYRYWNENKRKNLTEDENDPSILHSPRCKVCQEESDSYNNTYGFLHKCTQCTELKNDANPDRPRQRKDAKAGVLQRAKTGEKPKYKTELITKPQGSGASAVASTSTSTSVFFDIDMDQPALGETDDENELSEDANEEKKKEWVHPLLNQSDPDGPVPLPSLVPRTENDTEDIPFPSDNPRVIELFVYIARTLQKYGIQETFPKKFYNNECMNCGVELHWYEGDRVVATVHGQRLHWKYGTPKGTKGETCTTCEELLNKSRGVVDRDMKYSDKFGTPKSRRWDVKVPDYHQRTLSAFSLILSLPDSNGVADGKDLLAPKLDVTDKKVVARQIEKLRSMKCTISGRPIQITTSGTRESDKLSIDRIFSDQRYSSSTQKLQATAWGFNMMMGNMETEDRKKMLDWIENPDVAVAERSAVLQEVSLDSSSPWSKQSRRSKLDSFASDINECGYTVKEMEEAWENEGKNSVKNQQYRPYVEGRPGLLHTTSNGTEYLDRRNWVEVGASNEAHQQVAKKLFVSARGICAVTGKKFVAPGETGGGGWGMNASFDRRFDDSWYSPGAVWVICGGVNKFKSTLLAFRSESAWNELLETRPDLLRLQTKHGVNIAAASYIREEMVKK